MANKSIPESIAEVALHPLARGKEGRTHKLLLTLETRGAKGVSTENLSMIDRFRLLATAYLALTDQQAVVGDDVREAVSALESTGS